MQFYLSILIGILIIIIAILALRLYLMQKSAREIRQEFAKRLQTDTNTLIGISSRSRSMRALADDINGQLKKLRSQRHKFIQGDFTVKESITNLSHDIRTPLTAICGYLDLLEQENLPEDAVRFVSVIRERTERLKELTEELFRYSVAASADQSGALEEVVLNSALEESILSHYAVLKGCGITPEISMPEQNIIRRLDKKALLRIFENILGNAIKYSGGDLRIRLSESGEICFSNHAPHLNEIQVQNLFDRFYTIESGKKSTGLGLSIAKTLTEQMHGSITARYHNRTLSIILVF